MLVTYCLETADGSKTKPQKYWKKLRDDLEELHSFGSKLAHQPTAENRVIEDDEGTVLIWAKEMIIPNKLDKKKSFKPIEQADLDRRRFQWSGAGDGRFILPRRSQFKGCKMVFTV